MNFLLASHRKKKKPNISLLILLLIVFSAVAFSVYSYVNAKGEVKGVEVPDGASTKAKATAGCAKYGELFGESPAIASGSEWYLVGYDEKKSDKIEISFPEVYSKYTNEKFTVELVDSSGDSVHIFPEFKQSLELDPRDFPIGRYKVYVKLSHKCFESRSESIKFNVSKPVVVSWTQDWEGFDIQQKFLDDIERISKEYGVPMTHYWNPRIYVEGAMHPNRQKYLTNWVRVRSENGEEIALHVHMFDDLMNEVGIEDHNVKWGQRDDGYDRLVGEFSSEDFSKVLIWSKQKFIENGLPAPDNFRAGGWFASEETLEALDETGFKIDSSGREKYKLGRNQKEGYWNLSTKAQPFYPSLANQNVGTTSSYRSFGLIEMPNNGGNTWDHSAEQILAKYEQNYDGGVSDKLSIFTLLSHPHWHDTDGPKLDEIFNKMKRNNYKDDKGPVVYLTVSEAAEIWKNDSESKIYSN